MLHHVLRCTWRTRLIALTLLTPLLLVANVEAKRKRLDNKTLDMATELAKDRETHFRGEKAMSSEEFQVAWAAFAERLASEYEGHEVTLKKFGVDVGFRKGFAHVIYMALRTQTMGTELTPTAQEVVSKHPFLQELILEGSCYTGGDPFPKKMTELLEANPGIPYLLAEHLEAWDKDYQEKFSKAFPKME